MIEPRVRSAEEIEEMTEGMEVSYDDNETMSEAAGDAGREYITKMRDAGNVVLQNPYGEAILEIIVPRDRGEGVQEVIEEWDLNPSGHGIMMQPPSFSDDKPQVAKGLAAWQFMLTDGEGEELNSCGYDIGQIVSEIQDRDIPLLMTKAPRVRCSLPVE